MHFLLPAAVVAHKSMLTDSPMQLHTHCAYPLLTHTAALLLKSWTTGCWATQVNRFIEAENIGSEHERQEHKNLKQQALKLDSQICE